MIAAMPSALPRLVTFGISHFCEKARWPLDWHGVRYEEIRWPIGLHRVLAKRCCAQCAILPILLAGDAVVQGSGEIVDWADQQANGRERYLTVANTLDLEQRADNVIGVQVRRLAYAEMHIRLNLKPCRTPPHASWTK
jgi:glutathione S-transferase